MFILPQNAGKCPFPHLLPSLANNSEQMSQSNNSGMFFMQSESGNLLKISVLSDKSGLSQEFILIAGSIHFLRV